MTQTQNTTAATTDTTPHGWTVYQATADHVDPDAYETHTLGRWYYTADDAEVSVYSDNYGTREDALIALELWIAESDADEEPMSQTSTIC